MSVETEFRAEPQDHVVLFYERDEELIDPVGRYLADGLRFGEVALVVATDAHRLAFAAALAAAGIDVNEARQSGNLITIDADRALSRLMIGDRPDAAGFDAVIGERVREAARTGRRVRAYGEMVGLLWDAGQVTAALELEELWNDLGQVLRFSLFCAYGMGPLVHEEHVAAVAGVCRLHSAVVGGRAASSQSFKAGMLAPRAARRFVVETLARWGCDDLAADAALVVTELATNAVIHAKSDFIVSMTCQNDVVRISVRDDSVVAPTARRSPTTTPSGRGMVLVAATGRQWEAELLPDGKVVWVEFERVGRRD